jgi:ribosomal-protein-alanine N-acetyltransferase
MTNEDVTPVSPKTGYGDRLTVRPAKAEDGDYIRALGKTVFQQYGSYEDILGGWFESGAAVTLLAWMKKQPVGFAMLGRPRYEPYFHQILELLAIAVEPSKRRLGIGDLLMGEVQRKANELEVDMLVLHTAVYNLVSQKLFKKHGFIPVETRRRFYPEGQDALTMYKEIDFREGLQRK